MTAQHTAPPPPVPWPPKPDDRADSDRSALDTSAVPPHQQFVIVRPRTDWVPLSGSEVAAGEAYTAALVDDPPQGDGADERVSHTLAPDVEAPAPRIAEHMSAAPSRRERRNPRSVRARLLRI